MHQKPSNPTPKWNPPPKSWRGFCEWLLAKPFQSLWANWTLYLVLWESFSGAYLVGVAAREEFFESPPLDGLLQAANTWFVGLLFVFAMAAGAHGLWRDRRSWPRLTARQVDRIFSEVRRAFDRRDQVRRQWLTLLGIAYSGLLAAWWWLVNQDPEESQVGLALRTGVFAALATISAVAAISILAASAAANEAAIFLEKGARGHPYEVFSRRVHRFGRFADLLVYAALLLLTAFWLYLAIGWLFDAVRAAP